MSEERLIYKGQDVTVDVTLKIEHVINIIAEQERLDFDAAYRRFAKTQTYAALQNTNSLMWAESAEYIVDRYFEE